MLPSTLPLLPSGEVLLRQLLLAPCLEELVFRLGLQEHLLRRQGHWQGLATPVTALAFALAHVLALWLGGSSPSATALTLAAATLLPAWWIGRRYQVHRRWWPCALWHSGFNACWLLLMPLALWLISLPS